MDCWRQPNQATLPHQQHLHRQHHHLHHSRPATPHPFCCTRATYFEYGFFCRPFCEPCFLFTIILITIIFNRCMWIENHSFRLFNKTKYPSKTKDFWFRQLIYQMNSNGYNLIFMLSFVHLIFYPNRNSKQIIHTIVYSLKTHQNFIANYLNFPFSSFCVSASYLV